MTYINQLSDELLINEITDETAIQFGVDTPTSAKLLLTTLRKALRPYTINVLQKGADPTGATNSASAFNAAIADVPNMTLIQGDQAVGRPSVSRVILIPDGTYRFDSTVLVPKEKNIIFLGESYAGAVLQSGGVTPPDYLFQLEDSITTQHSVEFEKLIFRHGGLDLGSNNRRHGRIKDCQFIGAGIWAITMGEQTVEWTIEDCTISEGVGGINLEAGTNTDLIRIIRTAFIRNTGIDLVINNSNALIDHCDFEVKPAGAEGSPYVELGANCVNIDFRQVRFGAETPPTSMIRTGSAVGSSAVGQVKFTDCFFGGETTNCFLLNLPPKNWRLRDCVFGKFTTLFNEAFATSLANSSNAGNNYADFVYRTATDAALDVNFFSAGGIGWTLSPNLHRYLQGEALSFPQKNQVFRSNNLLGANWGAVNTTPVKNLTGPDGTTSGWTVAATANGSTYTFASAISVTGPITASVWLKAGPSLLLDTARLTLYTGTNWETGNSTPVKLSTNWKRYSITSLATGSRSVSFGIHVGTELESPLAGESIGVAFPQVNSGTSATSYLENDSTNAVSHASPAFQALPLGLRMIDSGTVPPASGYYSRGDFRLHSAPSPKITPGWACTTAGDPATFTPLPALGLSLNICDPPYNADPTGTTDSATAIQAAIDAAPDGTLLLFPVGTYNIGTGLTLNKGLILQGMGRGHEGSGTVGTSLKWTGSPGGTILTINSSGVAPVSVHGWVVRDMGFNGNGGTITGTRAISLGVAGDSSPKAAVGELSNLWVYNCDDIGIVCYNAQICRFHDVHMTSCTTAGMKFAAGTGGANTACLLEMCRANTCGRGFDIRKLSGATFLNCIAEQNQDEGYYLETGGTDEGVSDIVFINCWQEANLASGGTGRGGFTTTSTNAGIRNNLLTIISHKCGTPSAGNYCFKLHGAVVEMERPRLSGSGQGILLDGGAVAATSYFHGRLDFDPSTYITYQAGTGTWWGTLEEITKQGGTIDRRDWLINNAAPFMWQKRHKDYLLLADTTADSVNKTTRLLIPHYLNAEENFSVLVPVCTSGSNLVQIGGGSGSYNAATTVDFFAASNNTTLSGTKRASIVPGGLSLVDAHDIIIAATTGSKIGQSTSKLAFYGATPVVQQVLATGTGKTVDDVITALQTLGLYKQA